MSASGSILFDVGAGCIFGFHLKVNIRPSGTAVCPRPSRACLSSLVQHYNCIFSLFQIIRSTYVFPKL